jgi:hypothetical protein
MEIEAEEQVLEVARVGGSSRPDRTEQRGQGSDPETVARLAIARRDDTDISLLLVPVVVDLCPIA